VLGQMLLISQHAMQQASGLFGARLARLWQEIHWGSLLTMAPVWALANARPQLLEQWQQRVLVQGEPTLRVERELLGMRLLRRLDFEEGRFSLYFLAMTRGEEVPDAVDERQRYTFGR
ncbi:TPA: hypothetical protein ACW0IB_005363, partial [Escherichia coli]